MSLGFSIAKGLIWMEVEFCDSKTMNQLDSLKCVVKVIVIWENSGCSSVQEEKLSINSIFYLLDLFKLCIRMCVQVEVGVSAPSAGVRAVVSNIVENFSFV